MPYNNLNLRELDIVIVDNDINFIGIIISFSDNEEFAYIEACEATYIKDECILKANSSEMKILTHRLRPFKNFKRKQLSHKIKQIARILINKLIP